MVAGWRAGRLAASHTQVHNALAGVALRRCTAIHGAAFIPGATSPSSPQAEDFTTVGFEMENVGRCRDQLCRFLTRFRRPVRGGLATPAGRGQVSLELNRRVAASVSGLPLRVVPRQPSQPFGRRQRLVPGDRACGAHLQPPAVPSVHCVRRLHRSLSSQRSNRVSRRFPVNSYHFAARSRPPPASVAPAISVASRIAPGRSIAYRPHVRRLGTPLSRIHQ